MKFKILVLTALFSFPASAQDFQAADHIDIKTCSIGGGSSVASCVEEQVSSCRVQANQRADGYFAERACSDVAFEQADGLLNAFYGRAMQTAEEYERGQGLALGTMHSKYLRDSQRAWIDVRDATCELHVTFPDYNSGRDSVVAECKARVTMRRIEELQFEIGEYLD
ncbi:DUF1311 domain-containing protein [Alphaproteobacteria bacterium KMM 3653]|uniref:DUF1311 domain-containing protein n=1 Tax=Harenicola maris TaxID=2841044 RepID=A0AAP2CPS3_9RHOB|nr:DUF1311 domain-containing protein [Harenicola maris]